MLKSLFSSSSPIQWLDWPVPQKVKACYTLRQPGSSVSGYSSFNLGQHVGDDPDSVQKNRDDLSVAIGQQDICWLQQVHGITVVQADTATSAVTADAAFTQSSNQVCCVMTADCLPVFFCDQQGEQVAVAHAGWRGLCDGVLQQTLATFDRPQRVIAYLGPAISQQAFEVGEDVRHAFLTQVSTELAHCFIPSLHPDKWMADLYAIAKILLRANGVSQCFGGDRCTYTERHAFFSYRRDGVTGRMAHLIWIEE